MKKVLIVAIALMLVGCSSVKHNETIPTTPVGESKMPFLKQAVVMRIDGNYKVLIFFELPNPCHKIKLEGVGISGKTVTIDFRYTPPKPGTACIQVLQKFNETIDLGKLEKGTYTVIIRVNGSVVKVLRFKVD